MTSSVSGYDPINPRGQGEPNPLRPQNGQETCWQHRSCTYLACRYDSDAERDTALDSGDTAFVLISAAMVMFMIPGLALFYGGMVRAKNVLATVMQSFFCMGLVSVLWVLAAYSLAFSPGNKFIGGWPMNDATNRVLGRSYSSAGGA